MYHQSNRKPFLPSYYMTYSWLHFNPLQKGKRKLVQNETKTLREIKRTRKRGQRYLDIAGLLVPSFPPLPQGRWGPRPECGMAYFRAPQSPNQRRHQQSGEENHNEQSRRRSLAICLSFQEKENQPRVKYMRWHISSPQPHLQLVRRTEHFVSITNTGISKQKGWSGDTCQAERSFLCEGTTQ